MRSWRALANGVVEVDYEDGKGFVVRPFSPDPKVLERVAAFVPLFRAAEAKWQLPWVWLFAIAYHESRGFPNAVSPAGAKGLMQIMPANFESLGIKDAFDPAQSVDGAAHLLRNMAAVIRSDDLVKLLSSYNAGPNSKEHRPKTNVSSPWGIAGVPEYIDGIVRLQNALRLGTVTLPPTRGSVPSVSKSVATNTVDVVAPLLALSGIVYVLSRKGRA